MNTLEAIDRIETFDDEEDGQIEAYQILINSGQVWHMSGTYGRQAMELLRCGLCELGEIRFKDAYGNTVPSRYDVKPGTTGASLATRGTHI